MALTPTNNDAFLREVDDELRRDKTERFVRRYGRLLVLGVVLLLAAAGGYLWWQHDRTQRAEQRGEAMAQALAAVSSGRAGEAKGRAGLDALAGDGGGYGVAARLTLADLALDKGDARAAAAAYGVIANDAGVAQPFRDLALVRQTTAEFDTLAGGTVKARLAGLAVPGNPWFGSAGELLALTLLKEGKRAEAGRLFGRIAGDPGVPATLRSRAVQMAGLLGVDAVPQTGAAMPGGTGR